MRNLIGEKSFYDEMHRSGGYQGIYDLPYRKSAYYPLFVTVLDELKGRNVGNVLEVGCGTGALAHMIMERSKISYRGFDFSPVAIEKAVARTRCPELFYVADATHASSYMEDHDYDCVVCTEVLEHIEQDLEVISHWRRGCQVICSVPNYDSVSHVRIFADESEVCARYQHDIEIEKITRVKKPVLSDISVGNYLRALRWNRYRPRRIIEILGLTRFDDAGGWFVFRGFRR